MKHDLLAILDAHGPALHALLLRLTLRPDVADDLLQELFVRLSRSASFHAAAEPAAYLRRAAVNAALDWRREGKRDLRIDGHWRMTPAGPPAPFDAVADAEQVERILDAAAELSEASRQAFVMRYVQQESFGAIGAALGKTPHQARGLCHAAVRQLRQRLNPAAPAEAKGGVV